MATSVIVQFVGTFAVWILAERLGLSGIITMVVYAITVARTAPEVMPARLRIPSYAVWEVAVFVLNVLAFILVGLQLKPILQRLDRAELIALCVRRRGGLRGGHRRANRVGDGVRRRRPMALRLRPRAESRAISIVPGVRGDRLVRHARDRDDRGGARAARRERRAAGVPHRDLILFVAFCVVLGTLVLQGLTVTPLMHAIRLQADDTVEREVRLARLETARAGLGAVEKGTGQRRDGRLLRRKYEARVPAPSREGGERRKVKGSRHSRRPLREAQAAERQILLRLRASGAIGDDAFHRVEEELDWAEVNAQAYRTMQS